jgi:hypothetical protein
MPAPLVVAGVAARLAAKKIATNAAKKAAKTTVKKGTKSTKGQGMSTGKAKVEAYKKSSSKKYEAPVKGSGKPKYQNVIKEARVNTKQAERKVSLGGKKLTRSESQARTRNTPNLAKQIDREYKVQKGIRTEKSNIKVPVKRK